MYVMANRKWSKWFIEKNREEVESFISEYGKTLFNLNTSNKMYMSSLAIEMFEILKNERLWGYNQVVAAFRNISKRKYGNFGSSELREEYYFHRGYIDKQEIDDKISQLQRKNSKRCIEHWVKKGFTESDAILKVAEWQSKISKNRTSEQRVSVWQKQYWMNKHNFTLEQAEEAIKKYNPSRREFYDDEKAWELGKEKISHRVKKLWENGIYDDAIKIIETRRVSGEEKCFFADIQNETLKHLPFGVNVRLSTHTEAIYYVFDGYAKTKKGIILIEYDGTYWHNQERDTIRDKETLETRDDIIGIIRVQDKFYRKNRTNIKQHIEYAIKKIESKESNRVLLSVESA